MLTLPKLVTENANKWAIGTLVFLLLSIIGAWVAKERVHELKEASLNEQLEQAVDSLTVTSRKVLMLEEQVKVATASSKKGRREVFPDGHIIEDYEEQTQTLEELLMTTSQQYESTIDSLEVDNKSLKSKVEAYELKMSKSAFKHWGASLGLGAYGPLYGQPYVGFSGFLPFGLVDLGAGVRGHAPVAVLDKVAESPAALDAGIELRF